MKRKTSIITLPSALAAVHGVRAEGKNRKTISIHKPGSVMAKGAWWQLRAAGDEVVELLIYGDIGESWFGDSVTAADLVKQLQEIKAATINVRINSYGGSVSDGIAIFNALRRHPAEVHTSVDGVAFSIASLIAMAGDKVAMASNAMLMVHAPWGAAQGNAAEMRQYADTLDKFAEAMATAYVSKTGEKKSTEIDALLKDGQDHYYSAEEAKEFGFVDEITESLAVAASTEVPRYQGKPAASAAHKELHPMNWKEIAKALGMSENASVEEIKAKLRSIGLTGDTVTVEQVQVALKAASPAPTGGETAEQVHARLAVRNKDIRAAFAPFRSREGVADLEVEVIADTSLTAEQANKKLLAHLGQGVEPLGLPRTEVGESESDKRVSAASSALLARVGVDKNKVDGSNPFRGRSLREVARMCLEHAGVNTSRMDALELARAALKPGLIRGAQTTSDFPVILENTMHKEVLRGMQAYQPTYPRFCKIGDVSDFRAWNRIVPGLIGDLDGVNEHGEYKQKVIPDGTKNSVQASRKGNIISITPETIVNDDLAYILDLARSLGAAGPRAVDRAVFALLALNSYAGPALADGINLFHANHSNVTTGAPSVTVLSTMANQMAKQTAPGADAEPLDIRPSVSVSDLLVAGDIKVINEAQYDPDTANKLQRPNKSRGLLQDVVGSARAAATKFWLFADPNVAPVIEVVFLDGQREVRLVSEENFRTAGLDFRGELPHGVGAIDYRGGQYSSGV